MKKQGKSRGTVQLPAIVRRKILRWYRRNRRKFPWRRTNDAYHILVAEMMLRRTQAKQAAEVYKRFKADFPDAASLAAAPSHELQDVLRPLGLRWRNENFKVLADQIVSRFGGKMPGSREDLLSITGIGPYVADSILCHAHGQRRLPVDVNVVRVLCRLLGLSYKDSTRRSRQFMEIAQETTPASERDFRNWHYALLDFAASICKVDKPMCSTCPVNTFCEYFQSAPRNNLVKT